MDVSTKTKIDLEISTLSARFISTLDEQLTSRSLLDLDKVQPSYIKHETTLKKNTKIRMTKNKGLINQDPFNR